MGPDALRVAGIGEALRARGFDVVDRGNLAGPLKPWPPPRGRLSPSARSGRVEPAGLRRGVGRARCGTLAGPARRRPRLGDRLDQRGRAALPRARQEAAHALARRARRFQHEALTPSGNMHGMPVACLCGNGPASSPSSAATRRRSAAAHPPDRHPQRRRGRKAARARGRPRDLRHALHRRDRHEARRWRKRSAASMPTRTCT